jgi:hypothetical protein
MGGERKENGVSAIAQIDLFTRLENSAKTIESRVLFCLFVPRFTSPNLPLHPRSTQLTKSHPQINES